MIGFPGHRLVRRSISSSELIRNKFSGFSKIFNFHSKLIFNFKTLEQYFLLNKALIDTAKIKDFDSFVDFLLRNELNASY